MKILTTVEPLLPSFASTKACDLQALHACMTRLAAVAVCCYSATLHASKPACIKPVAEHHCLCANAHHEDACLWPPVCNELLHAHHVVRRQILHCYLQQQQAAKTKSKLTQLLIDTVCEKQDHELPAACQTGEYPCCSPPHQLVHRESCCVLPCLQPPVAAKGSTANFYLSNLL